MLTWFSLFPVCSNLFSMENYWTLPNFRYSFGWICESLTCYRQNYNSVSDLYHLLRLLCSVLFVRCWELTHWICSIRVANNHSICNINPSVWQGVHSGWNVEITAKNINSVNDILDYCNNIQGSTEKFIGWSLKSSMH